MRLLRLIVAVPMLVILVLFALSNRTPVRLGIWPTDLSVELPVSFAILGAMAATFLIGGLMLWVSAMGARGRARRAEHARVILDQRVEALERELDAARAALARTPATNIPANTPANTSAITSARPPALINAR